MVACRFGISLLVFNSTSHSFAALTHDSHLLYSLAWEQLGVTLKSFRRLFKLHTHDVKAKLIFRINYVRKLFLPNRQLKEYLCKMGTLHFIRDNAFSKMQKMQSPQDINYRCVLCEFQYITKKFSGKRMLPGRMNDLQQPRELALRLRVF